MRRLWFPLLIVLLLAACSNAPQKIARSPEPNGGAYRTTPPGFPDFVDHSIGREEISIQAMSLVGIPYRWGGNTPDSGFDCSGLVRYVVLRAASVNLPRTTAEMSGRGESIDPGEIAPGDLIFFNTTGRAHSHVGIYVGKLRFVNAPSTGGTVRLDYLTNPYWAKRFDGIRRVAPPLDKPVPFDAPTYLAAPREAPAPITPVPAAAAPPSVAVATQPPASIIEPADAVPSPMPAAAGSAAPPYVSAAPASPGNAPDPIAAAADAFEPPPLAAVAERQAQQAQQADVAPSSASTNRVQVLRASTLSPGAPAPSATIDDPIARFANGGD